MAKCHEVASSSCIPKEKLSLLIPDDVGIFVTNFTIPNFGGKNRMVQGGVATRRW